GLTIAAAVLAGFQGAELPPEYAPYIVAALGLVNVALRFITTTPVGKG
ncbi:MAG: hypothetical protein HRT62_20680, partial [Epibacterium sp.]|nr:hypothetical protein [Epibacterium sp.]